ncbi:hypothetical protein ADUPG1_005429, partial [Aduncisulcus paluster]
VSVLKENNEYSPSVSSATVGDTDDAVINITAHALVFKSAAAAARKVEQMKKLEEEQREQDREEGREREGTRERKKWGDRKKGRGSPSSLPRGIPPLSKNTLDLAKFHSI